MFTPEPYDPEETPPDYEILGVSLIGPPPLGAVHLRWQQTLTVLYGLNGAGKSTILNGIRDALTGSRTSQGYSYLHIRLTEAAFDPKDYVHDLSNDLRFGVEEWVRTEVLNPHGGAPWPAEFDTAPESKAMNPYELFEKALVAGLKLIYPEDAEIAAVARRATERRTFALWANGNGWTILPTLSISEPWSAHQIRQIRKTWHLEDGEPVSRI